MRNPWVALDVATDPVAHALRLRRAHETSLSGGTTTEVRSLVAESWRRSLAAGVTPMAPGAPVALTADELDAARERSPLAPAVSGILSALRSLDTDARHVVAIADAEGTLLWVAGNRAALELAREMRFEPGAAWSEASTGTNAVGTAAAIDHAVQIFSAEHLVAAVHEWTCSGAPIHDPVTGELIGVIDLTAELRTAHPHTLSLAALAAREAEAILKLDLLERRDRLREHWEGLIAMRRSPSVLVDLSGRVIAARGAGELPEQLKPPSGWDGSVALPDGRVASAELLAGEGAVLWLERRRRPSTPRLRLRLLGNDVSARLDDAHAEGALRSLELLAVLAMHPEGMSAEQLALALYGERGKTVTVRAQVHRVRAHLGGHIVRTQPYRLAGPLEGDWLDVARLVARGRPGDALRLYRGPLLPHSEAPRIAEERALLEESLRRSILTTADPDLLARWLRHPCGADDASAARALVAVLPPGDPRRAAATAISAAIARRMRLTAEPPPDAANRPSRSVLSPDARASPPS